MADKICFLTMVCTLDEKLRNARDVRNLELFFFNFSCSSFIKRFLQNQITKSIKHNCNLENLYDNYTVANYKIFITQFWCKWNGANNKEDIFNDKLQWNDFCVLPFWFLEQNFVISVSNIKLKSNICLQKIFSDVRYMWYIWLTHGILKG